MSIRWTNPSYILFFILLTSTILVSGQPTQQQIAISLDASADSYIAEDKPQWKAGAEDYLIIGYTKHSFQKDCIVKPTYYKKNVFCTRGYRTEDIRRIVLHFNLSAIPPGSEIVEAILQLHVHTPENSIPIRVYGLTECFKEKEVSWVNREEASIWKDKGGTHELKVLDMGILGKFQRDVGFYRFNVTDYYVKVFRGKVENCGILITPELREESTTVTVYSCSTSPTHQECDPSKLFPPSQYEYERSERHYAKFFSREFAQENDKPEYSPKLLIKFIGPSVSLKSDISSLELKQGDSFIFNVPVKGTFLGKVDLSYEMGGEGISLEGIKPVDVGSVIPLTLSVSEDAPPGSYFIKLNPVVEGYDPSYLTLSGITLGITVLEKKEELRDYFLIFTDTKEISIAQGGTSSFRVNLVPRGKFWSKVSLDVEKPDWLNVEFSPQEGVPNFASTITLTASPSAPLGDHEFKIIASGGNITRELVIKLSVGPPTSTQPVTGPTTTTSTPSITTTATIQTETSTVTTEKETTTPAGGGFDPLYLLIPLLAVIVLLVLWKFKRG
ncbi:MAG: DNRLRE domain-containing protein [Candidatus Korarchaeota archaeon]|nr:DNRLRE domain-containing protein [Candidatus Korarchaeota archaeon]